MPEALATTKRKFHRILDSITNSTYVPLPPDSSTSRPSTAQTPAERAAKRLRPSTSTASSSSLSSRYDRNGSTASLAREAPAAALDETPKVREIPNFSPWSHETFLRRLETFSNVSLWRMKPDDIGEVRWAKRGWTCVGRDTVACTGGCEKRVVVNLEHEEKPNAGNGAVDEEADVGQDDEPDDDAFEHAMVERYKVMIVDGHAASCLWRKAGCKDGIYRLPVLRPATWQPELRTRYTLLLSMSSSLDNVVVRSWRTGKATRTTPESLLDSLSTHILSTVDTVCKRATCAKALEIALSGWRGCHESGNDLLKCDACFQRVGLWMYQPDYKARRGSEDDEHEGESADLTIDLKEMHREHCPWRSAESQCAAGDLAGHSASQILWRVVLQYADEQRRRSDLECAFTTNPEESEMNAAESESAPQRETDGPDGVAGLPEMSREETARLDKERDSRLKKLKKLFTIKKSKRVTKAPT